jgi:hypothetical protein
METDDFKGFNILNTSPTEFNPEIKEVGEIPGALGDVTTDSTEDSTEEESGIKDKRSKKEDEEIIIQHVDSVEEIETETKDEEETEEVSDKDIEDKNNETDGEASTDEPEEEETVFRTIATEFSTKGLLAEVGEDFEDSEEGFAALIDKTVDEKVKEYKESLPEVAKNFIDFVQAGGDPQHYVDSRTTIDYNRISVDKLADNAAAQKEIVYNLLVKEGYEPDEISEEIADYEDGGLLANKAKRALGKLQKFQAQEQSQMIEKQKQEAEAQKEQYNTFLSDLKQDIDTRDDIAGFEFSNKKQRNEFYNYITKVDRKTGKTQLQADNEADSEAQLKMAWLYFNKFNFSKVEKKAKTKATSDLKAKLQKATDSTSKLKSKRKTSSPDDAMNESFSGFKRIL